MSEISGHAAVIRLGICKFIGLAVYAAELAASGLADFLSKRYCIAGAGDVFAADV